MKKILGLDLGTNSIGWAVVNEAENQQETASIVKLGVRVNPLTTDEQQNFDKGKSITTNADRTLKRSARRNLQRYRLRRDSLIKTLKENGFISDETILNEKGNRSTFETYRLRAKAVKEEITLEEFARVLLMINKKRGYKSSRKVQASDSEDGQLIDGMSVAKELYERDITPGQYVLSLLKEGKKQVPDFYRSDLQQEFNKIFDKQMSFYPEILIKELKAELKEKKRDALWAICANVLKEKGIELVGIKRQGTKQEQEIENYSWRAKALCEKIDLENFVIVLQQINTQINSSSGYLGAISDRSKELYFNEETVGEYLMKQLDANPNCSLKKQVFYRQDYLDEFEKIWETQKQFHEELTAELKKEIRDIVIFYQRRLKSQKGLISFCEFERKQIEVVIDGQKKIKTVGSRVCPKSSPLFQEFKIWQTLNNIEIKDKCNNRRFLEQEEKESLFQELTFKEKIKGTDALKLLFSNYKDFEINYKEIEGNRTLAKMVKECPAIKKDNDYVLDSNEELDKQLIFRLWHLLYSYEGDNILTGNGNLILRLENEFGFSDEDARRLARITFQNDYGSLSSKAIKKILPYLKEGNKYDVACLYAGYNHSKESLSGEEIQNKILKEHLDILPKNSLRNPVVEKILNQMINVINQLVDEYGIEDENGEKHFDEIRIELARELKKNAQEREDLTKRINATTKLNEEYVEKIKKDFNRDYVSRNDIIRYKLYLELKENGFKTLYSNTYIPYEKIFSKEYDIEHIIPQAVLFDDSFSNKTLEKKDVNIDKGKRTAYDYILDKEGEEGIKKYFNRLDALLKVEAISKTKYKKLRMSIDDIPQDFIQRDLRDSQYIAKKAKQMLLSISRVVTSTSGAITDRLREDWQLIDVMQELNWDKYDKLGLTEIIENKDGERIRKIKDWTKRNDHRHHAMDALTIAFTKPSYIQYLNNLNAKSDKSSSIYAIAQKELYRNEKGKTLFIPPIPLNEFRTEAKKQLGNVLVSIKAKNKVVTRNINVTKRKDGSNKKVQLTPRGKLHEEHIHGSMQRYTTKEEKVNASFTKEKIVRVAKKEYREALEKRLQEFGYDAKKAFTGKNSLEKNPIYYGKMLEKQVPEKVKLVGLETIYTIRKEISPDLKIDKVVDVKIRRILEKRLKEYGNDAKKAFSNIGENPIWLNKEKNICIKRVTITDAIGDPITLRTKKDNEGNYILNERGEKQAVDYVKAGNNHHVAIYRDEKGELQEDVVSFFKATARVLNGDSIVDKMYNKDKSWQFLFTMKQNEYFLFPNETTGFNPKELSEEFIQNPMNYSILSPNLFRVQKLSNKDYFFRHHLETTVEDKKELKGITWLRLGLNGIKDIVKVRVNHIGNIVTVGEY